MILPLVTVRVRVMPPDGYGRLKFSMLPRPIVLEITVDMVNAIRIRVLHLSQ